MQYRREIDGLRAVAVLPVILFHAGVSVFSGGYVGVDVFFVISGYLITSILLIEIEAGNFSIARFYERRARRILPALFVVVLSCIPFAWAWMTPSLFEDFLQSILAVIFFASNILFWREEGYFAHAAELKPLLHTWSLAVEEQYYLLFPLFMMFLLPKLTRNRLFWIVIGAALASLLLSEWGWRTHPGANFYLAPTRAWELFAGSLCAFLTVGRPARSSNLLSLAGLLMILFSIFAYDSSTPFPSLYAVVPVLGTVLIILFARPGTWTARLLSTAPFVGIGLISYSAYLWHQPLFAFARIRSAGEPSQILMMALAVAALLLAALTWRYVEQPFRKRQGSVLPTQKAVFGASAAASVAFIAAALVLLLAPTRIELNNPRLFDVSDITRTPSVECPSFENVAIANASCAVFGTGDKIAVVWGDSHAQALSTGLQPVDGYSIYVLYRNGCPPAAGVHRVDNRGASSNCQAVDMLDYVIDLNPDVVYLMARWTLYINGLDRVGEAQQATFLLTDQPTGGKSTPEKSRDALQRGLRTTINRLAEHTDVHVVTQPVDLHFMGDRERFLTIAVDLTDVVGWHAGEDVILDALANETQAQLLSSKDLFCTETECVLQQDGRLLYRDDNHLSSFGARVQWEMIADTLQD